MTGTQSGVFSLSTAEVDFGPVAAGQAPAQTIFLTNHTGGNLQFQVMANVPWLRIQFGQQSGDKLPLILTVDGTQIKGSGRQTAKLDIDAQGESKRISVHVGTAVSTGGTRTATGPKPTSGGSASKPGGRPSPSRSGSGQRLAVPQLRCTLSLVASALFHALLISSMWSIAAPAMAAEAAGGQGSMPAQVAVAFAGVYYVIAFRKAIPRRRYLVQPGTTDPDGCRLMGSLEDICRMANSPMPRVVLTSNPKPNVVSYGLSPRFSCMYVNKGLLDRISADDELEAALAHEVAHIARFDTLFFSSVSPLLWVIGKILFLLRSLFGGMGRLGRGVSSSPLPLLLMMRGGKGGAAGCIVTAVIVLGVMMAFLMVASYALTFCGFALAATALCLLYIRHAEKQADVEAATMVGDPDTVIGALAASVDDYPAELGILQSYGNDMNAVVANIKGGVPLSQGITLRDKAFRTHPTVLERVANVVIKCGSNLA